MFRKKSRVKIWNLELCKRSADGDGALEGDGDGGVDRPHHGHVDQAEEEGDQVGEENGLR